MPKPNYELLRDLVDAAEYKPGWTMHIEDEDGDLRLVLTDMKCIDAYTGKHMHLAHYHPVPPAFFTADAWQRWIYERCRATENHEIGEWLRWGNHRPFAPMHGPGEDPYTVQHVRDDSATAQRTRQDGSVRNPTRSDEPFRYQDPVDLE